MTCDFCGAEEARKVRLDILPWHRRCAQACSACMTNLPKIISQLRVDLGLPES